VPASCISAVVVAFSAVFALGACSSSNKSTAPTNGGATTTTPLPTNASTSVPSTGPRVLRVLVANDDGVGAPGINTLVEALRKLPNVSITVVAPAENQSGVGPKTTAGALIVTDANTAAGYPAKAVHGFPADTVVWAIDQHGVAEKPDVVVSGVNNGQNIGNLIRISGTVAVARAAARRGIPALAVSAGLAPSPDYADGARTAVAWLEQHRQNLEAGTASPTVANVNVPSCPAGRPRSVVTVPVANDSANPVALVNCTAPPGAQPSSDVDGFVRGYIVETDNLSLAAA